MSAPKVTRVEAALGVDARYEFTVERCGWTTFRPDARDVPADIRKALADWLAEADR